MQNLFRPSNIHTNIVKYLKESEEEWALYLLDFFNSRIELSDDQFYWDQISKNISISIEFKLKTMNNIPWTILNIYDVPIDILLSGLEFNWMLIAEFYPRPYELVKNIDKLDEIRKYYMTQLSSNKFLDEKTIALNFDLNWDKFNLFSLPSLSTQFLIDNFEFNLIEYIDNEYYYMNDYSISQGQTFHFWSFRITPEIIKDLPEYIVRNLNKYELTRSPLVTIDMILDPENISQYKIGVLTENPNFNLETYRYLEKHYPQYCKKLPTGYYFCKKQYQELGNDANLIDYEHWSTIAPLDVIEQNPDIPWNYDLMISDNNNITPSKLEQVRRILNNSNFEFDEIDYKRFSMRMNYSIKELKDNIDAPWDINYVIKNPDLDFETIQKLIEKERLVYPEIVEDIHFNLLLLTNPFKSEKTKFMNHQIKKIQSILKMQKQFMTAYYNTEYKFCRDRLSREFDLLYAKD
jgi:hypothetical protein